MTRGFTAKICVFRYPVRMQRLLAAGVIADVQVLRSASARSLKLLRSNAMGVDWDLHL
jgi:hypothetical protein